MSGETRILASDLVYDAGNSLNAAIDIVQVEGAFVMKIGFYLTEDIERNSKGKLLSNGTWTYKPPTVDTIPQKFNIELFNSPFYKAVSFFQKLRLPPENLWHVTAVGEPPLLPAGSVYTAIHSAVAAARKDYLGVKAGRDTFEFSPPITIEKVKALCGLDNVERYMEAALQINEVPHGKFL